MILSGLSPWNAVSSYMSMVKATSPIVGSDDANMMVQDSGDIHITLKQDPPLQMQTSVLDKEYTVTIETTGGLWPYCALENNTLVA